MNRSALLLLLATAGDPRTRYFTPPSRWTGGRPFEFPMTEEQWEILQAQYEREKEIVGIMVVAGGRLYRRADLDRLLSEAETSNRQAERQR